MANILQIYGIAKYITYFFFFFFVPQVRTFPIALAFQLCREPALTNESATK